NLKRSSNGIVRDSGGIGPRVDSTGTLNRRSKHTRNTACCCRFVVEKNPENAARKLLNPMKPICWKKLLIRRLEVRFLHGLLQSSQKLSRHVCALSPPPSSAVLLVCCRFH